MIKHIPRSYFLKIYIYNHILSFKSLNFNKFILVEKYQYENNNESKKSNFKF